MCKYSLEHRNISEAKKGETVYVVANSHGAFSSTPNVDRRDVTKPVCVLYDQKVTVENFRFAARVGVPPEWQHYLGTRQVLTLKQCFVPNGKYGDHFLFDNGHLVAVASLPSDLPIYVGVKPSSEKGMERIAEALTEISKTTASGGVMTAIKRVVRRKAKVNS